VKSGPGVLHTICVNTPANTGTVQAYDNTAASGNEIALVTSATGKSGCQTFDTAFWVGLTVLTASATQDVTVSFR
jgi:hypothetical protein